MTITQNGGANTDSSTYWLTACLTDHRFHVTSGAAVFDALSHFAPYRDARAVGVYLSMPAGEIQTDAIVRHALAAGKQVFVPYLHKSGRPPGGGGDGIPARLMDMVCLRGLHDYESLKRDRWGIPSVDGATVGERQRSVGELRIDGGEGQEEGAATAAAHTPLDLILMPGVAFDIDPETGAVRRLGHGKGFYDYFLHRYALAANAATGNSERDESPVKGGRPSVLLYALALTEQFLPAASGESVPVGPHDQPIDGVLLGDGQIKESADAPSAS